MTQGTKVGLLVSLAFLIVILVLLSDHVATTSDARPAQVTTAGSQVAQGITTPGPQAVETPQLVAETTQVAPPQPIPTVQEMVAQQAPPPRVDIGPGNAREVEIQAQNNVPVNVRVTPPVQVGPGASVRSLADAGRTEDPLLTNGFVPVGNGGQTTAQNTTQTPPTPAAPKSFEYKAMAGDTVSKMARKYYGLDTKANRDLIVSANKNLKADPSKVEVGKTYIIPVKPGSVSAAQAAAAPVAAAVSGPLISAPSTPAPTAPAAQPTASANPAAPAAAPAGDSSERSYTVRQGDNLWKIAKEQCGDAGALDQLKKLNADVLKNGIDLKVGTKLKLPAKKEQ